MRYDFDVEIAKEIGVEEAIMFANISWWCHKNATEKSERHFYDGHYWTFNTEEAWSELFGFWTIKQVSRILGNLEKGGKICSGSFNKKGYDRTKWYRPNKPIYGEREPISQMGECISPNGLMQSPKRADAIAQTGGPIPDSINTDRLNTDNTESLSVIPAGAEKKEYGVSEINELLNIIKTHHGSIDGTVKESRQYAHLFLKKLESAGIERSKIPKMVGAVIGKVIESGNTFTISLTTSPKSLYFNWAKIGVNVKTAKTPGEVKNFGF